VANLVVLCVRGRGRAGGCWRPAASLPLTGCPKTRRRRREAHKLGLTASNMCASLSVAAAVSSAAPNAGRQQPPARPLAELAEVTDMRRFFLGFARAPNGDRAGWGGREWRGAAFGAAGRDAVKTDKEAHMFERSEFVRFPFSRRLFREPRKGQRRCGTAPLPPSPASPITRHIPRSVRERTRSPPSIFNK
jgi:hypothetical protein